MNIVKHNFAFASALSIREITTDLILHHAAAKTCSVDDIHSWHLANGWAGIGYHFLVRKDGSVHEGRPIDTVGAHTYGVNSESVGVCFEGNFETEKMPDVQRNAGAELVSYIRKLFPTIKTVGKHNDYGATACPGKNFPFDVIAAGVTDKVENTTKTEYYRVRKTWEDSKSQIGAYKILDNAKTVVDKNPGYNVYDDSGKQVYPEIDETFKVRIDITTLRIRAGAGLKHEVVRFIPKGIYTITETKNADGYTWGRLKSGEGWIALKYAKRL